MKRYYKIGELSKTYNIGRDAIKYYEELKILNPSRDKNGYRVYSIDDVCRLNLIRELRNLNIPMKEIKEYVENRNIDTTKTMLQHEVNLINDQIKFLIKQKSSIENRLEVIEEGTNKCDLGTVKVKYYEDRKALIAEGNIENNENTDYLIQKLRKELEESFYTIGNNNIGSIFETSSIEENIYNKYKNVVVFLDEDSKVHNHIVEKGNYLSCTYQGPYTNNKVYLPKLIDYAKENGYEIVGDFIEIYDVDIYETSEENEFITSLEVRVL